MVSALNVKNIEKLSSIVSENSSFIFLNYKNVSSAQMFNLRKSLHASNSYFFVCKNSLMRRLFSSDVSSNLCSQVGFVVSEDIVSSCNLLSSTIKSGAPINVIGIASGDSFFDPSYFKNMSSYSSVDCMKSSVLSLLTIPHTLIVSTISEYLKTIDKSSD